MQIDSKSSLKRLVLVERLRIVRLCCVGLAILLFFLALSAIGNTVANPKTWSSDFFALAAAGHFSQYAVCFVGAGGGLLLAALIVHFVIRRMRI